VKILIVGGGGREHALAWALAPSATIFCAPGNPGTESLGTNLPILPTNHAAILDAIGAQKIDLTVIGPEGPLADGLADTISAAGYKVFGPSAAASRIEASKAFAKDLMFRAGIPTAASTTFEDQDLALSYISTHDEPLVVKASGLAAGKGAVVCQTRAEAEAAVREMFDGRFGGAGSVVVIEEFMEGEELSVFALTNGENFLLLPSAQDHKRIGEGDTGPNTGGMGAYSPVSLATDELLNLVKESIIDPTIRALAEEGCPYKGLLYVGIMVTPEGVPRVVEFNCRFGDPEAQVVLPMARRMLAEHMWSIAADEAWDPRRVEYGSRAALTTVLAAPGYPDAPQKGAVIRLPDELPDDTYLFHAGTAKSGDDLIVAGGRVLCATGLGSSVESAHSKSLELAEEVSFDGMVYRKDIGWREEARAGTT
jgi:phosphoribosylamine--glycine ligase